MDDVATWFKWLHETTGIKFSVFYDSYDRGRLWQGFLTTIRLSLIVLVTSLLAGTAVAWLQQSRSRAVRRAVGGYVQFFRNTPPLVQLYFFYFALSPLLPRIDGAPMLGSFAWAVIGLTLLEGAFNAEVMRAGIEAVPKNMLEAAESLGYSRAQTFRRVVLPLAFRVSMPALNNNLINLVKTTTLAYAIAVPEMVYMANQIWSEAGNVPEIMTLLLIAYLLLVGVVNEVMHRAELRLRIPGYGGAHAR